tara:strand:- start:118 stop:477 length:360 start_codon:yes stop_codon:yes gene_type:complete
MAAGAHPTACACAAQQHGWVDAVKALRACPGGGGLKLRNENGDNVMEIVCERGNVSPFQDVDDVEELVREMCEEGLGGEYDEQLGMKRRLERTGGQTKNGKTTTLDPSQVKVMPQHEEL